MTKTHFNVNLDENTVRILDKKVGRGKISRWLRDNLPKVFAKVEDLELEELFSRVSFHAEKYDKKGLLYFFDSQEEKDHYIKLMAENKFVKKV